MARPLAKTWVCTFFSRTGQQAQAHFAAKDGGPAIRRAARARLYFLRHVAQGLESDAPASAASWQSPVG
jgi:hypothetical protein